MSWFWGVLAVGGPQGSWQRVPGSGSQGWGGGGGPPAGAHLDGVVSEDACHAASAIGHGDRLAGGLEGGGLLRVEAVVVGCEGKK